MLTGLDENSRPAIVATSRASTPPTRPTLLVFADDWGRHPSSCQHLIGQLLDQYSVLWVNTIGTRKPRLNLETITRAWEKVRHWTRSARQQPGHAHLATFSPRMWPWFTHAWDRKLNARWLRRQLQVLLADVPRPVVALTTLPIVADLVGSLSVDRWVYYCVDDFSTWPGLDGRTLGRMETKLARNVDQVICVSETLRARLASLGRDSALLTHGVDLAHWRPEDWGAPATELAGLPRPLVLFWGLIDQRLDVELLHRLSASMDRGTIVLAGPQSSPDPALFRAPRMAHLPAVDFQRLPALAREAAALIMPYRDLPVCRAMQPLKLKEYLATQRPTIVRDLPATREWSDCLDLGAEPDEFCRLVALRLQTGLPDEQRQARRRLDSESWSHKADELVRLAIAPALVERRFSP